MTGEPTSKEIAEWRERLQGILYDTADRSDVVGADSDVTKKIRALAAEVGASIYQDRVNVDDAEAHIPEIAHNIHQALQTASMIDACRTAAKNSETALAATEIAREGLRRSQKVNVGLLVAAILSAIAAWVAVTMTIVAT